ncbi:hypothetical protein E2R51_12980 [Jeotgalibacillus sp. S-D1]|uniref:hypothetical protein n=1 Tax=Jeotgalibacillus sp. S-D1 TaxID=2552189 RepID=UPI0010595C3B|nr:hypothetical protein [Jeotgalibacillus sp. S-D1]TDL31283.1 hypothetical protein E2R51_12980 [Jeotgalibacillus sp. S-D1]
MNSLKTLGSFTLLRPIFFTLLVVSLFLLLAVLVPKTKNLLNGFTVACISFVTIVVCAQLLFYGAIIADETNLGGDAVSTYLVLIILGISLFNPFIYFIKRRGQWKTSGI